mmetsp:Transcript_11906/g.21473  ORF Transcript_11906/g.21473 Transcript_11906/m.21473 type:complete len:391 (-) Transcript_11906:203-1375(-)
MEDSSETDVLIVGGGLSGLSLARALHRQQEATGVSAPRFQLVEARPTLGGRIHSVPDENVDGKSSDSGNDAVYDMGPAWFWPGQRRFATLLKELDLNRFDQFAKGAIVVQGASGDVQVYDQGVGSMHGSYRVAGGIARVIAGVAGGLPADSVSLGSIVTSVTFDESSGVIRTEVQAAMSGGSRRTICSKAVVFAVPPQLVEATVAFSPPLPPPVVKRLKQIPTWMAGHAKVVAVYDKPFWRSAGLSGDGMSHVGPLGEIHDASPASLSAGALFGFVSTPASERSQPGFDLEAASVRQLGAMFGPEATRPRKVLVKDWATDPFTASPGPAAQAARGHHPYDAPRELDGLWGGRLLFSSTEVARQEGGFLEGALVASDTAFEKLKELEFQSD